MKHVLFMVALCFAAGTVMAQGPVNTDPDKYKSSTSGYNSELECEELAASFDIDPVVARRVVPPSYALQLTPSGKAVGVWAAMHCSKLLLSGVDIAPTSFIHFWIAIEGPSEVLPVPGAVRTLPTSYLYSVEDQVTNDALHRAGRSAGHNYRKIKSLQLSSRDGNHRTGQVVEETGRGYSWTETMALVPEKPLGGVNLRFWHMLRDSENVSDHPVGKGRVMCLVSLLGRNGSVTVQADPGTPFDKYFGQTSLTSNLLANFSPSKCKGTYGRGELAWDSYPPLPF